MLATLAVLTVVAEPVRGQQQSGDEVAVLSLQELLSVKVFSAARRERPVADTAAAVYVITAEDIRRSGAATIPDALRLVPGLQVASIDGNKWSVSSRGFAGRFSSKLLVLIDGRSIYTPLFSGVRWGLHDTWLEDVDRIEVIRGPGAALWGSNAVNGIINIITSHSEDSVGTLVTANAGAEERLTVGVRHGWRSGGTSARVYAKGFLRDEQLYRGSEAADDWRMFRLGGRLDAKSGASVFTLQGEGFAGRLGGAATIAVPTPPYTRSVIDEADAAGGHLTAVHRHEFRGGQAIETRASYDYMNYDDVSIDEARHTVEIDTQYSFDAGRHDLMLGAGLRWSRDRTRGAELALTLDPERRSVAWFSAFVQDDIALARDRVRLTIGTKLERTGFSGMQLSPNVRALWKLDSRHTLWAAASQAVRTPSRVERDGIIWTAFFPNPDPRLPVPIALRIVGNEALGVERLRAYEIGYRVRPTRALVLDLSGFVHDYSALFSSTVRSPVFLGNVLALDMLFDNRGEGTGYGAELVADWRPSVWARIRAGYSTVHIDLGKVSDTTTQLAAVPHHQVFGWAQFDLGEEVELDATARWMSELDTSSIERGLSSSLRLGWRPAPGLRLSLIGHNVLDASRAEFTPQFLTTGTSVQRAGFLRLRWEL